MRTPSRMHIEYQQMAVVRLKLLEQRALPPRKHPRDNLDRRLIHGPCAFTRHHPHAPQHVGYAGPRDAAGEHHNPKHPSTRSFMEGEPPREAEFHPPNG
jgi:hypothetical protein